MQRVLPSKEQTTLVLNTMLPRVDVLPGAHMHGAERAGPALPSADRRAERQQKLVKDLSTSSRARGGRAGEGKGGSGVTHMVADILDFYA